MAAGDGDMALYNWTYGGGSGEPDASNTLRSDALNNFSHYKNAEMDELLDRVWPSPIPKHVRRSTARSRSWWPRTFRSCTSSSGTGSRSSTPRVKGLPEEPLTTQFYNEAYKWWVDDQA